MSSKGFTLIELLIALFILGILFAVGIPRLARTGATALDTFLVKFNGLVQDAVQRAAAENKVSKILFNFRAKPVAVQLRMITDDKVVKAIEMPQNLEIEELFINRKNEPGRDEAWFFINPDGTSQEVIINLIDTEKKERYPEAGNYALILNPFTVQFKLYDEFTRPQV